MTDRRDHGAVSVELAVALPAVVLVLGLVVAAIGWATTHVRAAEAAAWGARLAAVEGEEAAVREVRGALPGAAVSVDVDSRRAIVTVVLDGPAWLPDASARSTALVQ